MRNSPLVLGVVFTLFATESLIHYQIGVWQDDGPKQFPSFSLPNAKDATAMALTSAVFSGLSILAIDKLSQSMSKSAESTPITYSKGVAVLAPNDNGVAGVIQFVSTRSGLKIDYNITGLSDGDHGFHIHEYGDLTEGCEKACAHFNPYGKNHGGLNSDERHEGDLGNITSSNNLAKGSLVAKNLTLDPTHICSVLGRMIIVHKDLDDLGEGEDAESLITGNAGKRVGCGVIGLMKS